MGLLRLPRQGEGFDEGYQSVPVNWGISSARKRGFFGLLGEMTGGIGESRASGHSAPRDHLRGPLLRIQSDDPAAFGGAITAADRLEHDAESTV